MRRKFDLFYDIPAWNKVFFAFFITLSCFLIFFFIALLLAVPVFNLSYAEAKQYIVSGPDLNNVIIAKFFQIFQSVGVFIIPPFILAFIFYGNVWEYLKLKNSPHISYIILSVLSIVISVPVINFMSYLNSNLNFPEFMGILEDKIIDMENEAGNLMESFLDTITLKGFITNIIMICILPAIGEELLFRGIFQRLFIEWTKNVHIGILIGAFLFSFIHMQFFGFLPRLLLGIYFGYLFVWSRTIWLPVIVHFFNNAFAVVYYYISGNNIGKSEIENLGTSEGDFIFLGLSIFLSFTLVYIIYLITKSRASGR
ncbi:MAG: CPBP family intramembrane metalloprotease [Bacteroidales bacterium]|nr:MAG: CPBP family intramembrane metalloprotease [Bacteroidales bacterium]